MSESVLIPARFNGPLASGNGGYSAGIVAGLLDGTVEVSLRRPVPLDTPLEVARDGDDLVRILDGEEVVIEGRSVPELDVDVPAPVTTEEAQRASANYRAPSGGPFSRCFVCGLDRPDAFGVFAGQVDGRELVASPWIPPAWTADEDGHVKPEFVWAVLDCPTYFALYMEGELPGSVLARLAARVDAPVIAEREHVVIAWPIEFDGRKHHAGAAVISAEGETLAAGRALLIRPREG